MRKGVFVGICGLLAVIWWTATAVVLLVPAAQAEDLSARIAAILAKADEAYGEYLAGQCVTCHHAQGQAQGIPPINGLPDTYLVQVMLDYQLAREERTNPAMVNVAKNLSDEELGSLARHFSKLEP
ncbi:MAG: hypothetical protein AAF441_11195 [Pseudomonadota bacterium]